MNQESRSISVELCGGITHESVVFLKMSPERGLFLKGLPVDVWFSRASRAFRDSWFPLEKAVQQIKAKVLISGS